jgi:uncharacterized protein (TIGR03086 family)
MDLVELFGRSVEGFTQRAEQVRPEQWTAPTPCTDWDVRALVNHIVYEQRWMVPMFGGATIAEVGDRFDGDLLGEEPFAAVRAAAAQAAATVAEPGALETTVHLSFGDTPAVEYTYQLLADHLVHAWDLAVAIGADRTLDPPALAACAEWFADREDLYRQSGAIGPRVEVPASASAQDKLIGAFGRDPAWTP